MNKFLIAVLINLLLLPIVFADSEQAASRYVEYWNMGDGRAAQNEVVFTQDFLDRRGPDGLAMIMKMVYADSGEIAIYKMTTSNEKQVVFVASSQNGNWMKITLINRFGMRLA